MFENNLMIRRNTPIKFTRVTSSLMNYILELCSTTARKYFLFFIVIPEVNFPLNPLLWKTNNVGTVKVFIFYNLHVTADTSGF